MNDRELLELAAKAVGLCGVHGNRADAIVNEDGYWMPHKDYGDALMLAETAGLLVGKCTIEEGCFFATRKDLNCTYSDPSICRAIVRAAAAIGEAMP